MTTPREAFNSKIVLPSSIKNLNIDSLASKDRDTLLKIIIAQNNVLLRRQLSQHLSNSVNSAEMCDYSELPFIDSDDDDHRLDTLDAIKDFNNKLRKKKEARIQFVSDQISFYNITIISNILFY